jgi:Spy/CpxP family protein refolding chaperone
MKKLLMAIMATAIFAMPALAQDKEKSAAEWDAKVKSELKMTSDQLAKYDALNKEYKGKMDALPQDASVSKDAQKEAKMKLKDEKAAKMAEFLTPEQMTKYKELVNEKMKKMEKKDKDAKS